MLINSACLKASIADRARIHMNAGWVGSDGGGLTTWTDRTKHEERRPQRPAWSGGAAEGGRCPRTCWEARSGFQLTGLGWRR